MLLKLLRMSSGFSRLTISPLTISRAKDTARAYASLVKAPIAAARVGPMPELYCTARRIGDYESRTEEYELAFAVDDAPPKSLQIKYQAARAYEINFALDQCVETARAAIPEANLIDKPTDKSLYQLSWKTLQSAKYEEGAPKSRTLELQE